MALPRTVFAACGVDSGLMNPLNDTCDLYQFLDKLLRLVIKIAFPVIVLFLVYIGWLFVYHGSNAEELKKAREYLMWAVIGALIILGAQALSYAIQATVESL